MEHHDHLKEQCCGASKYQRDLRNAWGKQWKHQGFASILAYHHLKETKRHANLEAETCAVNQDLHRQPGGGDQEIETDMQRLVLLGSTDKMELLRMSTNYDFRPPGACCPWLPSCTAE